MRSSASSAPNGAGKSTTIDLLIDSAKPTTGEVSVLGHDAQAEPVAVRRKTGVYAFGIVVLGWWIVVLPALALRRFDRSDL